MIYAKLPKEGKQPRKGKKPHKERRKPRKEGSKEPAPQDGAYVAMAAMFGDAFQMLNATTRGRSTLKQNIHQTLHGATWARDWHESVSEKRDWYAWAHLVDVETMEILLDLVKKYTGPCTPTV